MEFDKCPICDAELQTEQEEYRYGVTIDDQGNLVGEDRRDWGDRILSCKSGHTEEEILAAAEYLGDKIKTITQLTDALLIAHEWLNCLATQSRIIAVETCPHEVDGVTGPAEVKAALKIVSDAVNRGMGTNV